MIFNKYKFYYYTKWIIVILSVLSFLFGFFLLLYKLTQVDDNKPLIEVVRETNQYGTYECVKMRQAQHYTCSNITRP
jgi:hypothetical protein